MIPFSKNTVKVIRQLGWRQYKFPISLASWYISQKIGKTQFSTRKYLSDRIYDEKLKELTIPLSEMDKNKYCCLLFENQVLKVN
jgi:hypothetical protein